MLELISWVGIPLLLGAVLLLVAAALIHDPVSDPCRDSGGQPMRVNSLYDCVYNTNDGLR